MQRSLSVSSLYADSSHQQTPSIDFACSRAPIKTPTRCSKTLSWNTDGWTMWILITRWSRIRTPLRRSALRQFRISQNASNVRRSQTSDSSIRQDARKQQHQEHYAGNAIACYSSRTADSPAATGALNAEVQETRKATTRAVADRTSGGQADDAGGVSQMAYKASGRRRNHAKQQSWICSAHGRAPSLIPGGYRSGFTVVSKASWKRLEAPSHLQPVMEEAVDASNSAICFSGQVFETLEVNRQKWQDWSCRYRNNVRSLLGLGFI